MVFLRSFYQRHNKNSQFILQIIPVQIRMTIVVSLSDILSFSTKHDEGTCHAQKYSHNVYLLLTSLK